MIVSYRKVLALFLVSGCLQASEQLQQELTKTNLFPAVIDELITDYAIQDSALMKLEKVVQKHLPKNLAQNVIEYAAIEGDILLKTRHLITLRQMKALLRLRFTQLTNTFGTWILENELETFANVSLKSENHAADWDEEPHPELPSYRSPRDSRHVIPQDFPLSIFDGKRELTTNSHEKFIWLACDGRPIKLKLNNLAHENRSYGALDKALRRARWGILGIIIGEGFADIDRIAFADEQAALAAEKKDNNKGQS